MTLEELAGFDGRDGRPAYVAVGNTIYDVSTSARWVDGSHEGVHQAGRDLTEELKSAPHVRAVVERFPVAGRLESPDIQPERKKFLPLLIVIFVIALLTLLIFLSK